MILIPIRLQDYSQAVKPLHSQEFEPDLEDLGGCTKVIDIKDKIQKARAEAHTIKSERINQVSCRGKIALGPDYLTTRAICTCCCLRVSPTCHSPKRLVFAVLLCFGLVFQEASQGSSELQVCAAATLPLSTFQGVECVAVLRFWWVVARLIHELIKKNIALRKVMGMYLNMCWLLCTSRLRSCIIMSVY